jgi:hypothetical protein
VPAAGATPKAFKLNGKVYLLDASLVEQILSQFPLARIQKNKDPPNCMSAWVPMVTFPPLSI